MPFNKSSFLSVLKTSLLHVSACASIDTCGGLTPNVTNVPCAVVETAADDTVKAQADNPAMLIFPLITLVLQSAPTYAAPAALVETEWLAQHGNVGQVRIIDLRPSDQYKKEHVPGAVNVTRDDIRLANKAATAPLFIPSKEEFESIAGKLGISNSTHVVAYDDRGGMDPAWFWWLMRYHGFEKVSLLNGGWKKWVDERRPLTADVPQVKPQKFEATVRPALLVTADEVKAAMGNPEIILIDARTQAEIDGTERWMNTRHGGHIPGAIPVFWKDLLDEQGLFKSSADLKAHFLRKGLNPSKKIIAYCLAGMRSSEVLFGLYQAGYENLALYHGSWLDWGNRDDLPIATGEPILPKADAGR